MGTLRIKFDRGDEVKFISHLDLMKVFERTLRRAGLPIAYSQGFNPHPQMVFGLPLSVGVTSEAEYADFDMSDYIEPTEFINRMNSNLPIGIRVTYAGEKNSKGNIMADISGAVYEISIFLGNSKDINEIKKDIESFIEKDVVMAKKEGKSGIKDINIKPMIQKLEVSPLIEIPLGYEEFPAAFKLTALLNAGSVSNLKPELLISSIAEVTGLNIKSVRIHRKELFINIEGKLANPVKNLQ